VLIGDPTRGEGSRVSRSPGLTGQRYKRESHHARGPRQRNQHRLEGEGPETVVLISGLADDLETWGFQLPDLLAAGLRVLRFDNRGVGKTDSPSGPYTSRLLADDAKALVDHLDLKDVHLVGVSMGGMISQEYALAYGSDLRSLTLACTYAAPGAFCSRMFDLWGDVAARLGVPF